MAVASAGPYASLHLAPDRQPQIVLEKRPFNGCSIETECNSIKFSVAVYMVIISLYIKWFLF